MLSIGERPAVSIGTVLSKGLCRSFSSSDRPEAAPIGSAKKNATTGQITRRRSVHAGDDYELGSLTAVATCFLK